MFYKKFYKTEFSKILLINLIRDNVIDMQYVYGFNQCNLRMISYNWENKKISCYLKINGFAEQVFFFEIFSQKDQALLKQVKYTNLCKERERESQVTNRK